MDWKKKLIVCFLCCLIATAIVAAIPSCFADDHRGKGKHYGKYYSRGSDGAREPVFGRGRHHGDETTGQIAAWSLAAANLTVALSLLVRGVRRYARVSPEVNGTLARFNNTQKKYLMKFHYILNPVILLIGILHWTLSRCRETALPEWGLATMGVIVLLGIILKFRLCPKSWMKNIYRLHSQPVLPALVISMLLAGHLLMD
ncbi:MAG: hypothetical protein LLG06_15825 [Desulfobacteraceae bacterium]|nr:hypothetical protein [Desulfobacteraceae bacterium]